MILQPVDWHEHDVYGTYAIDVFGRRPDKKVVCVRLTGFRPYFFTSEKPDVFAVYEAANKKWVSKFGPNKGKEDYAFKMSKNILENPHPIVTQIKKYDTMGGFNDLKHANVWKVEFQNLATFKAARSAIKGVQYESNLPPFLRFFHEGHLNPASPLKFTKAEQMDIPETDEGEPMYYVDEFYVCNYKNVEACASCHRQIDPPGFALENFDVVGGWRERYRVKQGGDGIEQQELPQVRGKKVFVAKPVEAGGETADGKSFQDIDAYKQIVLDRDADQLARNMVEKLIVYATGAPIDFADRATVEQILRNTKPRQHGLRSLMHAVIQSPAFS